MKKEKKTERERCLCPYCEEEVVAASSPYCQACGVMFHYCRRCQVAVLDRKASHCPKCGEPLS